MTAPPIQQPPMAPTAGPQPPQPPPSMTVPAPWMPFTERPNDTEPQISAIWMRKLSKVISSVNYTKYGPEWKDVLDQQYLKTRQAAATASAGQGQPQQPQKPQKPAPGGP